MSKRIAQFVDTDSPGGAEVLLVSLCEQLLGRGYQPEIHHFGQSFLSSHCERLNIPSVIVPNRKLYKSIKTLPLFSWSFARLLKSRKVSLLHSHLFGPIVGGALASSISRIPQVGTLHDTYTIEERKARAYLLRGAQLLGTRLVTVSEQMRSYLKEAGHLSEGSLRTIPNGVSIPDSSRGGRGPLREELGIGEDDFVFICVGRLVELKRHKFLIEAFSKLPAESKASLLIVGEGPEAQALKELGSKLLPETGRLRFLDFREDITELLKASDCFVLASRTEGLSCSIAEAMAVGLPVVATDVGGNRELVQEGENGFLLPVDNQQAFAKRLIQVLENRELSLLLGQNSRARAQRLFSVDSMLEKYLTLYETLLPVGYLNSSKSGR